MRTIFALKPSISTADQAAAIDKQIAEMKDETYIRLLNFRNAVKYLYHSRTPDIKTILNEENRLQCIINQMKRNHVIENLQDLKTFLQAQDKDLVQRFITLERADFAKLRRYGQPPPPAHPEPDPN